MQLPLLWGLARELYWRNCILSPLTEYPSSSWRSASPGRKLFVDACLPFGLPSAPKIFNATADVLEWIRANESRNFGEFVLHYLDNFLFVGSLGLDTCRRSLDLAIRICKRLGF